MDDIDQTHWRPVKHDTMKNHLEHMSEVRPGRDGSAALWAVNELARLWAENEKLTARVGDPTANTPANAYWRQRFGTSDNEVKHLRAENEKLQSAATSVIEVLRLHWLTGIHCDHETKTDTATCYCTVWKSAPMPSVGAAVEEWIQHVKAEWTRMANETPK